MSTPTEPITTYQIIKDILIPGLGVISTIIIGIVIAILLRKREENAKIKSLLIDNYMEYLNKRTKFAEFEALFYTYEILKDIYIDYENYFEDHANRHIPKEIVEKARDAYKNKLDILNDDDSNWTPYTFKFCFLLGTKLYKKEAQKLENEIVKNIMDNKARQNFISELKKTIINDEKIVKNMNALNIHMIDNGIDMIASLITQKYSDYQYSVFKKYDNVIADLIDNK